jgi:Zn-dependent protease with chaperone function
MIKVMKRGQDAFLRAIVATVVFGILTAPVLNHFLIRVGSYSRWALLLFNYIAFFIPVFIGMLIYDFIIAKLHKES